MSQLGGLSITSWARFYPLSFSPHWGCPHHHDHQRTRIKMTAGQFNVITSGVFFVFGTPKMGWRLFGFPLKHQNGWCPKMVPQNGWRLFGVPLNKKTNKTRTKKQAPPQGRPPMRIFSLRRAPAHQLRPALHPHPQGARGGANRAFVGSIARGCPFDRLVGRKIV